MSHANHYHTQHQSTEDHGGHQLSPAVSFTGPSGTPPQPTADERKEAREEADLRAQQDMVRAAWVAVLISSFALIGLGFTVRYAKLAWLAAKASADSDNEALGLTRTQLAEARVAAEEQAAHMNRQVWAMQDMARASQKHAMITQDVAARQSRCYIEVIGGKFIKPDPEIATLLTNFSRIELECINHGESIGREVHCFYEFELVDLDSGTGSINWQEFEPVFKSEHPNVAPKSKFSIGLDLGVVKQVENTPRDGKSLAVIRGAVYYRDVFDDQFRSGFVLLGLFPLHTTPQLREIPFGMSRSSQDRPTFERVNAVKEEK